MRRPSLDSVMRYWPVVVAVIVASNIALAVNDAYQQKEPWLVLVPIAAIVVLCSQQGYYAGKRRGYEQLKRELTPNTLPCVGGPMDGMDVPTPVGMGAKDNFRVGLDEFPEGRYELWEDGVLHWVEE